MTELSHGPVEALEAVLFVANGPQSLSTLARAVGLTEGQTEQALDVLEARLSERGALSLVRIAGGFQLSTKPEFSDLVSSFLKPQRQKLRRGLLEVLAIVAYRQPVTLAEIERVRGVQSDHAVRSLVDRGFLRECGRKALPGRPYLYATTQEFLHQFGLRSLEDLPPTAHGREADLFSQPEPGNIA